MRVLVVEDDPSVGEALIDGLRLQGFDPHWVRTGTEGLAAAAEADVVLLDLGLPDLDGLEVCRRLRASSDVAIVVVSARGEEIDKVLGLETGADDYLVKPFSSRELVARLHALARRLERIDQRRAGAPPARGTASTGAIVRYGGLALDRRTRAVTVDDVAVDLTPKEFDLLAALLTDPGAVRRREELMEEVWDANWFGSTKTLNVHVASLRAKLGDPAWIETVRGVGFRVSRVR
ncbi:response regulator transcription factor [Egicoccus sp. AB-alg2]|uniref:response regulator transcription factor n=1 Tax=Egicoccus sp. AB-alg2 TaxID=3242693 RepID=UPI00359D3799